jgi:hypothetical protein
MPNNAVTFSATFTQVTTTTTSATSTVSITIDSSPEMTYGEYGWYLQVDGNTISTPETFSWQVGSVHTLTASLSSSNYNQYGYYFDYWQDEYTGSVLSYSQTYSYTVPRTSDTILATFEGQGQGNECLQYEGNVCVQWQSTAQEGCLQWEGNVCVQWQSTAQEGCLQWEGNVCVQWQGTTQVISTQTMRVTTTSSLFTTLITTTTGFATTQVSTTDESIYLTELEHSYGTMTRTQYVYLASLAPNNTLNNPSATAGSAGLNFGSLVAGVDGYVPLLAMAGAVAIPVLVSAFMMSRRRGRFLDQAGDSAEMDATVLDYISAHNGAISMGKASEDLGVSRERLGEAIMRLKADGKLLQRLSER